MSEYQFVLPLSVMPPSSNSRLHWSRRAHLTAKVRSECAVVARSYRHKARLPETVKGEKRTVRLTLIKPRVRGRFYALDGDNLASVLKPCLDALRPATAKEPNGSGWIAGDTADDVEVRYAQEPGDTLSVRVEVSVPEISDQVAS